MPRHGKEYIGRGSRGRGASPAVTPVAERAEGGAWTQLGEVRALFPPEGSLEVRGVAATSMRDGDWYVFAAAQNDRHRAPIKFRAMASRRLLRLLDLPDGEAPEARRRLLVEIGLETGSACDWAIRIAPDAVVKVALAQAADGRWRAVGKELASLPVKRFDAERVAALPDETGAPPLYDYDGSDPVGRAVNWSSDADHLRSVSLAIAGEGRHGAAEALEALSARISRGELIEGGILDEAIRSGAIAERLREDAQARENVLVALVSEPSIREHIESLAEAKASAEIPSLEAAARAKIEAEAQADLADRLERVRAAVSELEAEELAAFENRRAASAAAIEAALSDKRAAAEAALKAEFDEARQQREAEMAALDERMRSASDECGVLSDRRSRLADAVDELNGREAALLARVEMLARTEESLDRKAAKPAGPAGFACHPHEAKIPLAGVEDAAKGLKLLSPRGIEAVTRLAVLFAAGEVPLLRGPAASDLVETASHLLAGGRLAKLFGDPTTVTFEDLWSRAGGTGPTALGRAVAWTADQEGRPVIAFISGADRAAARFWFPALADAKRRGLLPGSLMVCVGLDDPASEEAAALPEDVLWVEAEALFSPAAVYAAGRALLKLAAEPRSIDLAFDAEAAGTPQALVEHGAGLPLAAALRVWRLHAAALDALGAERADRFAADVVATLGGVGTPSPDSSVIVSLAAHA